MASLYFRELYARAFQRDCAVIHTLNQLMWEQRPATQPGWEHPLPQFWPRSAINLTPVCHALFQFGADLEDDLLTTARQARMRVHKVRFVCPYCGQSQCPGAVPARPMPEDLLDHLLAGGHPLEYLADI